MTFREKLKREHPEMVNERYIGGCKGCPGGYGYGDNMPNCSHETCAECWNSEIPGSEALSCSEFPNSSDLISRQAAIDLVDKVEDMWLKGEIDSTYAPMVKGLKELPTIQPEKAQLSQEGTTKDAISKFIDGLEEIFADLRERYVDDSVCGLCEYDGAYMGQSGDWCNECPGFNRDDCFKLSDKCRKEWTEEIIKSLSSAQPDRKQGKWIYGEHDISMCDGYRCDKCGFFVPWDYKHKSIDFIDDYHFCPNCGARMEGEG